MATIPTKKFRTGVYIDASNLFWAQQILYRDPKYDAWRLDFAKFKAHLDKKYDKPLFYKYYSTVDTDPSNEKFELRAAGEERFRKRLEHLGFEVIRKPLKYITDGATGKRVTKGDTDVEVTMGIVNTLSDVDMIVLVSGDSDYYAAIQDFYSQGKYIQIYSYKHILAREIRDYCFETPGCSFTFFDTIRDEVEYINR